LKPGPLPLVAGAGDADANERRVHSGISPATLTYLVGAWATSAFARRF
jgi:hypothetical protein